MSQISILRVQSGPIKNSLVALSTLTVAEEGDDEIEETMDGIILAKPLSSTPTKERSEKQIPSPLKEFFVPLRV